MAPQKVSCSGGGVAKGVWWLVWVISSSCAAEFIHGFHYWNDKANILTTMHAVVFVSACCTVVARQQS